MSAWKPCSSSLSARMIRSWSLDRGMIDCFWNQADLPDPGKPMARTMRGGCPEAVLSGVRSLTPGTFRRSRVARQYPAVS